MPKKPADLAKQDTGGTAFFAPDFYPDPQYHGAWDNAVETKHHDPELFGLLMGVSSAEIRLAQECSIVAGHEKWLARVLIVSLQHLHGLARPATGPGIVAAICQADRDDDLTDAGFDLMKKSPAAPVAGRDIYESFGGTPTPQKLIDICAMCIAFPATGPHTAWWQEQNAISMASWLIKHGITGDDPLMALRRLVRDGVTLTDEGRGMLRDLTASKQMAAPVEDKAAAATAPGQGKTKVTPKPDGKKRGRPKAEDGGRVDDEEFKLKVKPMIGRRMSDPEISRELSKTCDELDADKLQSKIRAVRKWCERNPNYSPKCVQKSGGGKHKKS